MVTYISLDDFLDSYEQVKGYTEKTAYHAYQALRKGAYPTLVSFCDYWSIPKSTASSWKNNYYTPISVQHSNSLEEKDLLPLTDSSTNLDLFKELYLYCLFSGSVTKHSTNCSVFYLSESKKNLIFAGKALKQLGLDYNVYSNKNGYKLIPISSGDRLIYALSQLLIASGFITSKKTVNELFIPKFVDSKSLAFYLFNLKGCLVDLTLRVGNNTNVNEKTSRDNLNLLLDKLSSLKFNFKGYGPYLREDNLWETNIRIEKGELSSFKQFLQNYKPKLLPNKFK